MVISWTGPTKAERAKARAVAAGVCATVRLETHSGKAEAAEFLLSDMAFKVRADEKACTFYSVTRQLGSTEHFAVHARFENWDAFKRHAETPHMETLLSRLTPLLAAPVALEIFLEV